MCIGVERSTIEVLDSNNKRHYLVNVAYDVDTGKGKQELNGNERNAIAKKFIERYSYVDVLNLVELNNTAINAKIDRAEKTKYLLEDVIAGVCKISGSLVEPMLKPNSNTYQYYISYKLNFNNSIEIYLSDVVGLYRCKYKGEWLTLNRHELDAILKEMINIAKSELKRREDEHSTYRDASLQ